MAQAARPTTIRYRVSSAFASLSLDVSERRGDFGPLVRCIHICRCNTLPNMLPGLVIRSSSIHAAGCYTARAIRKGTRILEYDGPRLSKAEADRRYEGRCVTYLFACGEKEVIDGFGTAMFLNHCCDPNCETEQDENGRIYISSIRDIAAGEELTYEYNLHDSDDDDQDCYCGAANCRGTMFSEEEVNRRKRKARRLAASIKTGTS
jgi:SET domain-containing protein